MSANRTFNLADLFEIVAAVVPQRVAFKCGAQQLTFRQLDEGARRLATALRERGVRRGDNVGIQLYNSAEYLETFFAEHIGRPVDWKVLGKNGVTARRTIEDLIPHMPDEQFDYILLGIGGNDVMKLSSPRKWRTDMLELISIVREKNLDAVICISNCPMIIYAPALPEPIRSILWRLSQMHNANIVEFTRGMDRVFYYPQPADVRLEGFWADGIHPSEQGYADWAEAMIKYFAANHEW